MGQLIEVRARVVGDVALFDTDRSITGQDGERFTSAEEAEGDDFPNLIARRIFAADPDATSVFVASNGVSVERSGGWDDRTVAVVEEEIARFFIFYGHEWEREPEDVGSGPEPAEA